MIIPLILVFSRSIFLRGQPATSQGKEELKGGVGFFGAIGIIGICNLKGYGFYPFQGWYALA